MPPLLAPSRLAYAVIVLVALVLAADTVVLVDRHAAGRLPDALSGAVAPGHVIAVAAPAVAASPRAGLYGPDPLPPPASAPAPAPPPAPPPPVRLVPTPERLRAFAGLSTWVDLYDTQRTPHEQIRAARAGGVQTVFVQSARFNSPADIHDPGRLGALIEAAHDAGMRVMVWYIPDFVDLVADERRARAAMTFRTPRGDTADAFGLDIETEFVPDPAERTQRLLALAAALRGWAGPDYPMAAIVLPPLQLDLRPGWWPQFPYAQLRASFDVFIPMSYSSYRGQDAGTTHAWNLRNVDELRARAGDEKLFVHLAGGIADALPELDAFLRAAEDARVVGAGLYDLHTTRADAWPLLRALRSP